MNSSSFHLTSFLHMHTHTHTQLGWRPLVDSYLVSIPDCVSEQNRDLYSGLIENQKALIQVLIDWLVQPSLDFIRHECKLFITTSPLHLVNTLLNLYTCLLDEFISGYEGDSIPQTQVCKFVKCVIIIALR